MEKVDAVSKTTDTRMPSLTMLCAEAVRFCLKFQDENRRRSLALRRKVADWALLDPDVEVAAHELGVVLEMYAEGRTALDLTPIENLYVAALGFVASYGAANPGVTEPMTESVRELFDEEDNTDAKRAAQTLTRMTRHYVRNNAEAASRAWGAA
jgi:hypothetical protein